MLIRKGCGKDLDDIERIWSCKGCEKDVERMWKGCGKDAERTWKGYVKLSFISSPTL